MTTTADLVAATREHLLAGHREPMNRLDGPITAAATSLTLKYDLGPVQAGSVLSVDLERIRVWETSGKTVAVAERGVDGTVAAAHDNLATVTANSRFDAFAVVREINNDLADLSSPSVGLFKVEFADLTFNAAIGGYDLGAGASDIVGSPLKVLWKSIGPSKHWPEIRSYRYDSNMPTADFASGRAIFIYEPVSPGQQVRVFYPASFTPLPTTLLTTDVATTGLPTTAHDLPPLGAAIRLMAGREIKRNFTEAQGDTRRAEEVPPGAVQASPRGLATLRAQRISAEVARLHAEFPVRLGA